MPVETRENVKVNKEEERKEVLVDFEGKKTIASKALVPEDAYDATFMSVSREQVPSYDNPKVATTKIIFQVALDDAKNTVLPLFANPIIKKSSGTKGYSDSKLYSLLEAAGLLDAAKKQHEALETFEGLAGFLDANFKGRRARVVVKVSNKGTENAYSTIGNVVRFLEEKPNA